MVGLAVGIDYALFVVNRQRRLILDQGLTAREAAGRAVGTAGSAVFFAGLTVLIALSALTVIGIAMLSTMAPVAASTVAPAVLIALTLLPALLGLVGGADLLRQGPIPTPRKGGGGVAQRRRPLGQGCDQVPVARHRGRGRDPGRDGDPGGQYEHGYPNRRDREPGHRRPAELRGGLPGLRRGIQRPPPSHRRAHRHRRPRHTRADRETPRGVPGPRRHRASRPRWRQRGRRPGRVQRHPHLRPQRRGHQRPREVAAQSPTTRSPETTGCNSASPGSPPSASTCPTSSPTSYRSTSASSSCSPS
ncbi:MMPL family transporter [Janibacter limosus]|uniref:MMPL family transporter n=1 Tax=Janibacter limosus TaxID=53458 RepID=UPI0035DAB200